MTKSIPILCALAVLTGLSGCAMHRSSASLYVEHVHSPASVQKLSELGFQLGRNLNPGANPATSILVAPAVKHDGQLRPSQYGEALATSITAGLIQSGLQVVEGQQTGWTSGKPVIVAAKERATAVNASVLALGSYHHVGSTEIVAYRLVDVRTGRILSFADLHISGGAR